MDTYRVFQALGDPTRQAIFERLAKQPSAVGELARQFPISRPAVSQHLRVLKQAGLVVDEQAGTRRIYRVDPERLSKVRDYFDRFWTHTLTAFSQEIDQIVKEER